MPDKPKKQKIKMTPEQMLELVKKIVDPLVKKVGDLEKTNQSLPEISPMPLQDGEFVLKSRAAYLGGKSPEKEKAFNTALADLMKSYKIISIRAELIKKW